MAIQFQGRWRGQVVTKNAGFSQRIVVSGAAVGSGTYNGVVGNTFVVDGDNWQVELQWNNGAGSGWQPSAMTQSFGMTSPLVVVTIVAADDNVPSARDNDFDDLVVWFEHLDPVFEVVQRPFALDRGTLTMLPDGIFDTSQGVQYMGVRIRNTWFFDWESSFPPTGMKIGIAPASRVALASQGIQVLDSWSPQEQEALGQVMDGGFVRVGDLEVGGETLVYFKVNVANAAPGKPEIGFVAQRDAYDPNYDAPTRWEKKPIFLSRSSYNPVTKELVAQVPEGTLRMRLHSVVIDRKAASKAALAARECFRKYPGSRGGDGKGGKRQRLTDDLRELLRALLAGKDVDSCQLRALLELCCEPCDGTDGRPDDGGGRPDGGFPGGGLGDGPGAEDWCRIRPVPWLPVEFEYRIEPNPPYSGQLGPLAFEDPWWKVVLIILAVLLAIASLVADYVGAAQDKRYIIGKVARKAGITNNMDAALSDLNGTRGVDLGELDAQHDDVNNGFPIVALDSIIQLDRSDNGNFGVENAVLGNVVWKSGGTSGTTRGTVSALNFSTIINYDESEFISGEITFTSQVLVTQIATMVQPLSQGGDSGSVWVDLASSRPVALNFFGDVEDLGVTGGGSPIRAVIDNLDVRFNP